MDKIMPPAAHGANHTEAVMGSFPRTDLILNLLVKDHSMVKEVLLKIGVEEKDRVNTKLQGQDAQHLLHALDLEDLWWD